MPFGFTIQSPWSNALRPSLVHGNYTKSSCSGSNRTVRDLPLISKVISGYHDEKIEVKAMIQSQTLVL